MISTKVYVEHDDLPLSPTIRSLPDIDLGIVSDAGTDPENDVRFIWITADDFDGVEAALDDDHTVAAYSLVVDADGRRTYRLAYSDAARPLSPAIVDIGGITLEARRHLMGWKLHLQLMDHEALFALKEYATDHDIRLDVLELQQDDGSEDPDEPTDGILTEPQREAMVGAFVQGYYDEPREVSLEELATLLDISPTAVSGRLRRGSARLVEELLIDDEE